MALIPAAVSSRPWLLIVIGILLAMFVIPRFL